MSKKPSYPYGPHPSLGGPLAQLAPGLASAGNKVHAAGQIITLVCRAGWRYRAELTYATALGACWWQTTAWVGDPATGLLTLACPSAAVAVALAVPPAPPRLAKLLAKRAATRWMPHCFGLRVRLAPLLARRWWGHPLLWASGALSRARTRRRLEKGMRELRMVNASGKIPKIRRVSSTAVGHQVVLHCQPGQSAELLDARAEELRAAARSRDVRITRDPNHSHKVIIDVVRRDPLATTPTVGWLDHHADVLSAWDPVHFGMYENATPVRLDLRERQVLMAGAPGTGKSSGQAAIVSHFAKSPDAHLVLIDPNEVQFAPWKDRALAFATDDPTDAINALQLVRDEVKRRMGFLRTLPGVVRKVTRAVAVEHNLPLWLLAIDELAFHTSVVGTPAQRNEFSTLARDVVARCRAAGIIPVMGTQRPTSDVVPTSLRDLFSVRVAYRTTTISSSDVILGEGWARRGYSATDIDLSTPGIAWLLAEGESPRRVKTTWIPDETIADLSVTTIRHRPNTTSPAAPLVMDRPNPGRETAR